MPAKANHVIKFARNSPNFKFAAAILILLNKLRIDIQ